MVLYFPYFFAFSLLAGIGICVLFSFLAARCPTEDNRPRLGKGRICSAILVWMVGLFMFFTATMSAIVSEAFTNSAFYDRYERVMRFNDFSQENLLEEGAELSLDEQKIEIRKDLWITANMIIGTIASINAGFACLALGLYILRFRSSSSSWKEKLAKVVGYTLMLYLYFDYWTLASKIFYSFNLS